MAHSLLSATHLSVRYDEYVVMEDLSFDVDAGETFAIVGGSGSGKSTLLKSLVGLVPFYQGDIQVLGHSLGSQHFCRHTAYYRQIGFLFQEGALFGSLTVLDNVAYPLQHLLHLSLKDARALALLKLALVGLPERAAFLYPTALSGGMRKRVALARALALDPPLVFLDEPTAGLDPEASQAFDDLVVTLRDTLNLTIIMVTHDLSTLKNVATRIGFLNNKKMICGTLEGFLKSTDSAIQQYFGSKRARELWGE